jgi:hypothetical protein
MHLTLVCPGCGSGGSIEFFLNDADGRRAVAIAAELGTDLGPVALRYLKLFAPAKNRLTWPRARKLMEELQALAQVDFINRRGRAWPVTRAMWVEAMEQMLGKREDLNLPLKSNGYLLEILAGMADKTEAQAERAHEAGVQQQSSSRYADDGEAVAAAERHRATMARSSLIAEKASRQRLGMPAFTPAEELAFLANYRV